MAGCRTDSRVASVVAAALGQTIQSRIGCFKGRAIDVIEACVSQGIDIQFLRVRAH